VLRPRPAPSPQDQRSDGRGQMSDHPCRPPCAIRGRAHTAAPPMRVASASRIPMLQAQPHPTSARMKGDGRTCFTVTTRFTISTDQRTEDGRQTNRSGAPTSVTTRWSP
jgi:hypothetical protein